MRINAPTAVRVLMLHDVERRFRHTLGITRSQKHVQNDVVSFERGIGFEFTAPVAFFVLLGEQTIACAINGRCHPDGQIINFSETHVWHGRGHTEGGGTERWSSGKGGGCIVHISFYLLRSGRSARNGFHDFRRQAKAHVLGHDLDFLHVGKAFRTQELHDFLDQTFRSRGTGGQRYRLHAFQPFWPDVAEAVD